MHGHGLTREIETVARLQEPPYPYNAGETAGQPWFIRPFSDRLEGDVKVMSGLLRISRVIG
jgi:hypothetical protein